MITVWQSQVWRRLLIAALCLAASWAAILSLAADPLRAAPGVQAASVVDPETVDKLHKSIDSARDCLLNQFPSGGLSERILHDEPAQPDISTVACTLQALNEAGAEYAKEPAMQRGYAWLIARHRFAWTGVHYVSDRVLALCAVKDRPAALQKCLEEDVKWLLSSATPEGHFNRVAQKDRDRRHFNDTIAAYWVSEAMSAADKQGVRVPANFWPTMLKATWDTRDATGGWQEFLDPEDVNPSGFHEEVTFTTTAAALCTMKTCIDHLTQAAQASPDARGMAAGLQQQMHWLDAHTAIPTNGQFGYSTRMDVLSTPSDLMKQLPYDWMAILARLRAVTGQKSWGKLDPYPLMAKYALKAQNIAGQTQFNDGGWGQGDTAADPLCTSRVMLFLLSEPSVFPPPAATTAPGSPANGVNRLQKR